jgi:hypothetical protein
MIHYENGRMNEGKKMAFQCIFHPPLILSGDPPRTQRLRQCIIKTGSGGVRQRDIPGRNGRQ